MICLVEQIKKLCSDNNTSVKALEKELGFGNGTIRRWDTNAPSFDKIVMVANRFNVPVSYLTGEETKKAPTQTDGRGLPHAERREILAGHGVSIMLDADAKLTDAQLEDIINFIEFQQGKYGR